MQLTTAAPDGSRTVPTNEPNVDCALQMPAPSARHNAAEADRELLPMTVPPVCFDYTSAPGSIHVRVKCPDKGQGPAFAGFSLLCRNRWRCQSLFSDGRR